MQCVFIERCIVNSSNIPSSNTLLFEDLECHRSEILDQINRSLFYFYDHIIIFVKTFMYILHHINVLFPRQDENGII